MDAPATTILEHLISRNVKASSPLDRGRLFFEVSAHCTRLVFSTSRTLAQGHTVIPQRKEIEKKYIKGLRFKYVEKMIDVINFSLEK